MSDAATTKHNFPVVAQKGAYAVDVEQGRTYSWCACGLSAKQPFCDGTHKNMSTCTPIRWTAPRSQKVYFCGCKQSVNRPLCDGTHGKI
jgi:CDGSH-type Zn-finger protein